MTKPTDAQREAVKSVLQKMTVPIKGYNIDYIVNAAIAALSAAEKQMVTIYFCRGCGMMLRHEVGTAVCDNCGNDQDPIEGKFAHDQAIALSDVA